MNARTLGMAAVGLLAFGVAATGCGGSSSSSTTASCTLPAGTGVCIEFSTSGLSAAELSAVQSACSSNNLTYSAGACSATNVVPGHCSIPESTIGAYLPSAPITSAEGFFYTPNFSATTAAATCSAALTSGGLGGTWVSG